MRYFLISFLFIICFHTASSQETIDLSTQPYINIGKQVTIFEDRSGMLDLEQIKNLDKKGKFKQGTEKILNLGNSETAFWIKVRYVNNTSSDAYLVVDVPNIEYIDCYAVNAGPDLLHIRSGCFATPSDGVIAHNNFIFTLPEPDSASGYHDVYLRVKTNNIMLLPIKMVTHQNYTDRSSFKKHFESVYIGVLLTLLLFSIFLYISTGGKMYLYYGLYLITGFIYLVMYLRGYSYWLGDDFRSFLNHYPHAFLGLSSIAGVLFSWKFLDLPAVIPIMRRAYYIIIGLSIVLLLTSIIGFKQVAAELTTYNVLVIMVVLWIAGVLAFKKRHKPAKFYLLALVFRITAVIILNLNLQGIVEMDDYIFELFPIATAIEMLILVFALGDHHNDLIKSEQQLREENLQLVYTHNQRLTRLVEERTIKLSDTILQLESSNAVKDKLFSIIAHDLRTPFNSLTSIFSLKDMDMLSFDELKMLLSQNRKNIDQMRLTLDNLLYWAKSQMEASATQFSNFEVKDLFHELVPVYEPLAQSKNIQLNFDVKGSNMVYADLNQVRLILRNLIDNAIKFTPLNECVYITMKEQDNGIVICVSNPVTNPEEVKSVLSGTNNDIKITYGTANEHGIGLGLQLCREYARINGSKLEQHIDGDEVAFYFTLSHAS